MLESLISVGSCAAFGNDAGKLVCDDNFVEEAAANVEINDTPQEEVPSTTDEAAKVPQTDDQPEVSQADPDRAEL
eukprot:m.21156 g.21156  ORF g.21156 m.21156 type:complete len:75 (+) comp13276_c1_seq1:255-479(+)